MQLTPLSASILHGLNNHTSKEVILDPSVFPKVATAVAAFFDQVSQTQFKTDQVTLFRGNRGIYCCLRKHDPKAPRVLIGQGGLKRIFPALWIREDDKGSIYVSDVAIVKPIRAIKKTTSWSEWIIDILLQDERIKQWLFPKSIVIDTPYIYENSIERDQYHQDIEELFAEEMAINHQIPNSMYLVKMIDHVHYRSNTKSLFVLPLAEGDLYNTHLDALQMIIAAKAILQGIADLHRVGLRHGDIKPENILVFDHKTRFAITDFGFIGKFDEPCIKLGTRDYLAPEVFLDDGRKYFYDSGALDAWAVGVTLTELFFERAPFTREELIRSAQLQSDIQKFFQNHSHPVTAILLGLLVLDPTKRLSIFQAFEQLEELYP